MVSVNEFPIATANEIPGFKIIETKGFVYGLTVRSRGVGGQVSAGLRSLVGGEIKEYVSMMEDSRDEALERLIEHAKQLGGNAIVAVRFDSNDISNVMQEILAYGTAPFIAEPYFGHRSRLYDLDLHRNPDAIADIIIESYNHGVRAINLVNDDALIKGFDMALDEGCDIKVVATVGKSDVDYMNPNYDVAKEVDWEDDIELFDNYDCPLMLVDEFIVDGYDWNLTSFLPKERQEFKVKIEKLDKKIIATRILAAGILKPAEAFDFLNTLDYVDLVTFGVASKKEVVEDVTILKNI